MITAVKRKARAAGLLAGMFIAMSLTGCGENKIPDISDAQMAEVKDYVAMTMMKYHMGRTSRLVDLSKYSNMGMGADQGTGETQDDNQGMAPVDDTPIVNSTGGDQTGSSGTENAAYRLEEVLGLPEGVTVTYQGEEIYDSYPESGDIGFYMGASEGKKLLVTSFLLSNGGEQDQIADFGFPDVVFQFTVNGKYSRNAMATMLPGEIDMLTFNSTVPAGSSREIVLLIEVDEELDNISSLSMGVQKDSRIYRFQLKN